VNWEIARYTAAQLAGTAFQPILVRQPDRDAPAGVSGRPAWQEASLYYMKAIGAPPAVWEIGVDDYARDINTRPLYANWMEAVAVLSIHNNGGEGTGTETWFDATNGHEAASQRLADVVNRRIVNAIRRDYNPNWPDRGLRSCNGCKGENRLASRPAVIVEIAFMDTQTPDNAALQDERFKQIVARALREALYEWSGIPAPPAVQTD
jgi:N-acetylmuramoyl-L-alanine amidase